MPARALRRLLLMLTLCAISPLTAAQTRVAYLELVQGEQSYLLNADIDLDLPASVREAIGRGVPVHFIAESRVERPRWYWFDQEVEEAQRDYRLSYHAITRSYRLSIGSLHQSFETLDEALATLLRIRSWPVLPFSELETGVPLQISFRFRLDVAQLPRPFQLGTLTSREWNLATPWQRWSITPRAGGRP